MRDQHRSDEAHNPQDQQTAQAIEQARPPAQPQPERPTPNQDHLDRIERRTGQDPRYRRPLSSDPSRRQGDRRQVHDHTRSLATQPYRTTRQAQQIARYGVMLQDQTGQPITTLHIDATSADEALCIAERTGRNYASAQVYREEYPQADILLVEVDGDATQIGRQLAQAIINALYHDARTPDPRD